MWAHKQQQGPCLSVCSPVAAHTSLGPVFYREGHNKFGWEYTKAKLEGLSLGGRSVNGQ